MISGDLNEYERKLYNGFLKVASNLIKKNPSNDWFSVPFNELKQVLNLKEKDKNYTYIRTIMENMSRIKVEYNLKNKDAKIWGSASLLDNIQFVKKNNEDGLIVQFTIPKIVTESIKNQNQGGYYANIDLVIIRGLSSKYSILLYEIVSDYKNVEIPIFSIEEFRKIFGLQNKYTKIKDIKKRVLDVACKELNANPDVDFCVSYKLIKQGRSYTHLKFLHQPKSSSEQKVSSNQDELQALFELVPEQYKKLKTLRSAILRYYQRYGFEYCRLNILYANQKATTNYRVFLLKGLQKNWGKDFADELALAEQEKQAQKQRELKRQQELAEQEKIFHRNQKYLQLWESLAPEEKAKYQDNFIFFRAKYHLPED